MKSVEYTRHAIDTMARREITPAQVIHVLRDWENRWSTHWHQGKWHPNRAMYQGQEIALVVDEHPDRLVVITVLLREVRQWNDEDARRRTRQTVRP